MRCIPAVLLTLLLLFSAVSMATFSSADDPWIIVGDFEYEITGPDTATVCDYFNNTEENVVIPEIVPGTSYKVTAIDATFSQDCIHTISIPRYVSSIENYPFTAENLTSFTVDGGNTDFSASLDGTLFNFNKSKLVKYPSGKTNEDYTIPDSVVEIEPFAFQDSKVKKVITDKDLVIIGDDAFYYAQSLEEIVFPETSSLTMIGAYAFSYSGLKAVDFPWSLTFIGKSAFENTKLTSVTIKNDDLEYIGDGAFSNCSLLKSFNSMGSTYTTEDGVLFYNNKNIKTLAVYPGGKEGKEYTIPADVNNIEPNAFSGTVNLEKVILNDNMTFIPEKAFAGCVSLKTIDLSRVTIIENMAFDGCTNLSGIEFSDNLTYIGFASFYETAIETIEIPSSVTFIGGGAFALCTNLNEATFAESCNVTIMYTIFPGSVNMQKITINSRDVKLEENSLSIGTSEEHTANIEVLVPNGYEVPANAWDEYTTVKVSYIGERPYPWVNIIGAIVCGLGIIGILYGMRQV